MKDPVGFEQGEYNAWMLRSAVLLCMSVLCCIVFASGSPQASVVRYLRMDQWVRDVDLIARVRVLDREELTFVFEGRRMRCGFAYLASVTDSLKGSAGRIKFYSEVEDAFAGLDEEYFVFAYLVEKASPEEDATRDPEEVARSECLEQAPYGLYERRQSMFRFDREAAARFGGQWLRQERLSVFSGEAGIRHRRVEDDQREFLTYDWTDVRARVRSLLETP